ncbi:hypothetical protein M752DRAFT_293429 [Aspergillus phoenicis ATCC 13157]|uniref:Uncharacterized protein n=1 Tax=Aspergillus phoenicis ATCC 13157 TaxID=1353007 RepID=A0A370PJD6_ASPPH|nr:hypothetical protein M752DRAFT_293429 [Aspergillus phoenicis ATCC 13157]
MAQGVKDSDRRYWDIPIGTVVRLSDPPSLFLPLQTTINYLRLGTARQRRLKDFGALAAGLARPLATQKVINADQRPLDAGIAESSAACLSDLTQLRPHPVSSLAACRMSSTIFHPV